MTLESRITELAQAVGADIKALQAGGATTPTLTSPADTNSAAGVHFAPAIYSGGGAGDSTFGYFGTSEYVAASAGSGFANTHDSHQFTTAADEYEIAGIGAASLGFSRTSGFIFEAAVDFGVSPTGSNGFVGLSAAFVFGSFGATPEAVGVGWAIGDTATELRTVVATGAGITTTPFARTGAGGLPVGNRFFRTVMSCPPGGTTMTVDLYDETCQFYALQSFSLDISDVPATALLAPRAYTGTAAQTAAVSAKVFVFNCVIYPPASSFGSGSTNNILGNAATATKLSTPHTINGVAFDGSADITISAASPDAIDLPDTVPSPPAANTVRVFGRSVGGRMMPAFIGPSGLDSPLQPHFGRNRISAVLPNGNGTVMTNIGVVLTAVGTATAANVATTNRYTRMKRLEYLATTAATTAVAGFRCNAAQNTVGAATEGDGGFHMVCRWGPATGVAAVTSRAFCGMGPTAAPTDVNPSTVANQIGMGWDATDTNIQIVHRGAGAATKIDLGVGFPRPTADRSAAYELSLFSPPGPTQKVSYEVTDLVSGAKASGTITSNLPLVTLLVSPRCWSSVGGTSSVTGVALMGLYIETDL